MNDELKKYFTGAMSATEKAEFLNRLRNNPEAKKEFARMKICMGHLRTHITGRRPGKDRNRYS